MNWDPFQREVLAELGHRLYRVQASHPADEAMLSRLAQATGIDADVLRGQADIAATTMSYFISSIPPWVLRLMPPVSKVMPLPTST